MTYSSATRRTPMRSLRPKKQKKQPAYAPIPPMPPIALSATSASQQQYVKKPMRPLTAYHIFFQLEREFIIQSMAGPDADKTMHDNKSYMCGVPRKYRCTKLLPDWYAGPGKRTKRKHRKSHGKIGFLELSRVISKRWAILESNDPETKQFVGRIAAAELADYKMEVKEFKALAKNATISSQVDALHASATASAETTAKLGAMISPSSSPRPPTFPPAFFPMEVSSSSQVPPMMPYLNQQSMCMPVTTQSMSLPDPVVSLDPAFTFEEEEIDYSICSKDNDGHYIPSPAPGLGVNPYNLIQADGSICDPLFELDVEQPTINKRCVSPVSSNMDVFVSEADIFKLMDSC